MNGMRRRFLLVSLLALIGIAAACGPKKYVLLSPEDDYSDDPAVGVRVERVAETVPGRTEVAAILQNNGQSALPLADASAILLDADEKNMPLVSKPSDTLEPGVEKPVVWAFDTTGAAKGALEMRLEIPGVKKIWPIIFSTDKPPDFKPTPEQGGPPGPQGPPGF